jgi:hypothetical protein
MGCERRVILCITCGEIIDAEIAHLERKRAIEHRFITSTTSSRSSMDKRLALIYVLVDGECQTSTDGVANTSWVSDGYRPG